MTRNKAIQIILALVLVLALGIRGLYVKHPVLVGGTMGTGYSVTLSGYVSRKAITKLSRQIEAELVEINRQMSTWDPKSGISIFNQSDESGPFPVSEGFSKVVRRALKLGEITGGAFDPTLNPLLNLWGFGSESEERKVPSDTDIAAAMEKTGSDKVWVDKSSNLWKAGPEVQLALGAIAKGHGVDAIGQLLDDAGHENWFAEIGGEVVVRGTNPKGKPWRIGIQHPSSNPAVDKLQGIVNLTEGAVATSGDYRNHIEQDGVLHSHILDPRSGRAVLSDTASVTVVAPNCMDADGMATALFVMGADEGLAWVEERPKVEAMFLVRGADGEIFEKFSSGFTAATGYAPEN
ncbi:MAG: FAD:protein FMN transferase [Verrucomicrobiota bacterium]